MQRNILQSLKSLKWIECKIIIFKNPKSEIILGEITNKWEE